jgi:hypothetical protein
MVAAVDLGVQSKVGWLQPSGVLYYVGMVFSRGYGG